MQNDRAEGGESIEGSRMSFFDHLQELATRLKRILFAFIIAFAVISSLPNPFHPFGGPNALFGYDFLLITLLRRAETAYAQSFNFIALNVTTPISVFINLSLVLSVVVIAPYIFSQIYGFVSPGLYRREKRVVRKYTLPFAALFGTGGLFGLFIIFPIVMRILLSFFPSFGLEKLVTLDDFVNLLILVPVISGLAFTFPVFLVPMVELKVLNAKQLSNSRKWVYIVVPLAVVLINPDPTFISSLPIILPIFVLYEVTILIAKRIEKRRAVMQEPT